MRISVTHTTTYHYDEPVERGLQELRLWPRRTELDVLSWRTELVGARHQLFCTDQFANTVELISLEPGTTSTTVTAIGEVVTVDAAGVLSLHDGFTPLWLYRRGTPRTAASTIVRQLAARLNEDDPIGRLHELAALVRSAIAYRPEASDVASTAHDALVAGAGVCQDHAHAFLAAARHLGVPSRYVSGYLASDTTGVHEASHAWAEAWVDGLGWVGLDVTNGISPDDRYVRLAVGLDYDGAAPVSGLRSGDGAETLAVSVEIQQQ